MNSQRVLSISPGWGRDAQTEIETLASFCRHLSTIASAVNGIVGSIMHGACGQVNRNAYALWAELEPEK